MTLSSKPGRGRVTPGPTIVDALLTDLGDLVLALGIGPGPGRTGPDDGNLR